SRPHLLAVRLDPRRLADDRGVDAHERAPGGPGGARCAIQEDDAVGVLPSLIGGREVRSDVAEPGGSQDRVHDRVREDVSVRMAGEPSSMVDDDRPEQQRASVFEAMSVESEADAKGYDRPRDTATSASYM